MVKVLQIKKFPGGMPNFFQRAYLLSFKTWFLLVKYSLTNHNKVLLRDSC